MPTLRTKLWCLMLVSAGGAGCSDTEPAAVNPGAVEPLQITTSDYVFDARAAGPVDGEVVLLLHGFPETSYEWREQLTALGEAGYRAIAPDQRGYSAAARPPDVADYEVLLLISDVVAMADALSVDRFHLVGHDWGAAVAWGVGAVAPERLLTLNTFSVPHPDALDEVLADEMSCQYEASSYFDLLVAEGIEDILLANDAAQLRAIYEGLTEETIDHYVAALGSKEVLTLALNWYRANLTGRRFNGGAIGAITVPTMFVWSDGDVAICPEGANLTEDYVTGPYRFEVIAGANHWIPEVASAEVSKLLLSHLAQ